MRDFINFMKSFVYGIFVVLGVLLTIGTFVMGILIKSVCEEESKIREREFSKYHEEKLKKDEK